MKKFVLQLGQTPSGKNGYALRSKAAQPATKEDIKNLEKNLIWPPKEMRDTNLLAMQKNRDLLNQVWMDERLDPTTKLLKAAYYSHMFSIANKKYFSRDGPGARLLAESPRTPLDQPKAEKVPRPHFPKQMRPIMKKKAPIVKKKKKDEEKDEKKIRRRKVQH